MTQSQADDQLLVDDVVEALTRSPAGTRPSGADLREQMRRASEEFDRVTARSFAAALVESLCDDPSNVRRLEALLILGLAHPDILVEHQVSLATEGRRLAVLLERQGEPERARSLLEVLSAALPDDREVRRDLSGQMRRLGEVDELIERLLRRAGQEVDDGRPSEAVACLQEILLHDPSRRDVARMIRDLRYQELEIRRRHARRRTQLIALTVLSGLLLSVVVRERRIAHDLRALPVAAQDDRDSQRARLAGLDRLLSEHRVWAGMFAAAHERAELQGRIDLAEARQSERERERLVEVEERRAAAEAAREQGLLAVERGDMEAALGLFESALECAPSDWQPHARVVADVAALGDLLGGGR